MALIIILKRERFIFVISDSKRRLTEESIIPLLNTTSFVESARLSVHGEMTIRGKKAFISPIFLFGFDKGL